MLHCKKIRLCSLPGLVDRLPQRDRAMMSRFARNAVVLGLLSATGPFAIDMYLPALPTIATDLKASVGATQMSLMAFFAAIAVCQVIYGPLADMLGRKTPLYFGLALFAAASIGCLFAPNIEWLIAFRFLQGVGACAGMVIPRAIVRDLHTGVEATRLMSLIMLVFSVSPILAPLTGSAIIALGSWRGVFVVIATAALLGLVLLATLLPETRTPEQRVGSGFRAAFAGYAGLLRDRRFLGLSFIGGLGMSSFFSFLATSSFVYIDHFGLTPTQYSIAFSINAIGFIGSAQFSARLATRFGLTRVVSTAVSLFALFILVLFGVTLAGVDLLPVLMVLLFLGFTCLGLVIPATVVLALEEHGPIAGTASALMGTLQMVSGAAVVAVVSAVFDGTALPMVSAIAACSVGALVLARVTLRVRVPAPALAE
jgi:DHA1 family bicyclomycin/chloramphenicol resistance-like MFS transporter